MAAIDRAAAQAETRRELDALMYAISHDLRAPLRSIDGFSQALLEDCAEQLDEEGRRHLQRIRAGAERMAEMIDGLLELARIAQVELRSEPVDLSTIARAVVGELEAATPERAARVEIAAALPAHGDPRLLRVALTALIGNAWKFTAREPLALIEVGADGVDGEQRFFVGDNGVGFDMRHASKLFNPFGRLHSQAEFPGTGIGLVTAQRIVHRHGGRIWADAIVGARAKFSFTLPARGGSSCTAIPA
jgi:light-regulated signal transduction histidine kinase (bacteriophytochrome)